MYIKSIRKGTDYKTAEKAIVILISNKNIKNLKELNKYHTKWQIIETEERKAILTEKLEIHIIELEKIKGEMQNINEKLLDWLTFLNNPESERVKEKMKQNENLKEAKEKLEKISEDTEIRDNSVVERKICI